MRETQFSRVRICFFFVLALLAKAAPGQEKIVPELDALQKQYDAQVRTEALQPFEATLKDLNAKYTTALDRAQAAAQQGGKLGDALAMKEEKERIAGSKPLPDKDDPTTPMTLKPLRATYRASLLKLEADRDKKLRPFNERFMKSLFSLITSLTKQGRLEDATAVKKVHDKIATSSGASGSVPLAAGSASSSLGLNASKDKPFVNSLGMKFVPVVGTTVLFCIHPTRVKDYAIYAGSTHGVDTSWKSQESFGIPISRKGTDPVVGVNWAEANSFCAWLSKKEGRTYRLPTDREWSFAVGIGPDENVTEDATPESLHRKIPDVFPWGNQWPPPKGAGNFSDTTNKGKSPTWKFIEGYNDGFAATSPVMSFEPNKLGLFDMGGNVCQWCDDWYNATKAKRVLRGSNWTAYERNSLLSSFRVINAPETRSSGYGFRCVLVVSP